MCGKDAYPTWRAARSVARRQMNKAKRTSGKRVHTIEPYPCELCGALHLTGHNESKLKKVG